MAVAWALNKWATNSWVGMNGGPPNAWRGASTPVPPTPTPTGATQPSGVGRGRVFRLSDLSPESRQSTADFLKAQLGLDEKYAEQVEPQKALKAGRKTKAAREAERLAELAMRNAAIEAENEIRTITNNNILILMMMASE